MTTWKKKIEFIKKAVSFSKKQAPHLELNIHKGITLNKFQKQPITAQLQTNKHALSKEKVS